MGATFSGEEHFVRLLLDQQLGEDAMSRTIIMAGVGMTAFVKPGTGDDYQTMAAAAATAALDDAGIAYGDLGAAFAGYVYGDSAAGQSALYRLGLSGIPIVNVSNNCATGSTALHMAAQAVAAGAHDCVLALGFEQMRPGALGPIYGDRADPLAAFVAAQEAACGRSDAPVALRLFGSAGLAYQARHGTLDSTFAQITVKARRHAEHNSRALFRAPLSVEAVLASPAMFGPLTRLQCCPPTCGAAAAIVCAEAFARRRGIDCGVRIAGQAMVTDRADSFADPLALVGAGMSARASQAAYEQAGTGPDEIDVVELHDCFTSNEIISYEALGLVPEGGAERFVIDGDNSYGGQIVVNPSGGLLSKGHPLGATGLAQAAELVWQLRGVAGARQVEGSRIALQHNIGLGGACIVTVYERAN